MKETYSVIIVAVLLLGIAYGAYYINEGKSDFNFYKSQLTIDGLEVKEKVYFSPDKDYHTLFRDFQNPLLDKTSTKNTPNSVTMQGVFCSFGDEYFKDYYGNCFDSTSKIVCKPYTESNEFGCTFGSQTGFKKGEEYQIEAEYILSPENIFQINGKNYIKFVAYSPDRHVKLKKNKNFFVNGDVVTKSSYGVKENVIVYIPTNLPANDFRQTDFEFDKSPLFIPYLTPFFFFILTWLFFGRDKHTDLPDQLSTNPSERKPWEVAAFFNPPFGLIDKNFFSTLMFDFYRRKIIEVKIKKGKYFGKDFFVKINDSKVKDLDDIEKEFLKVLLNVKERANEKYFEGDYFNFKKAIGYNSLQLKLEMKKFNKKVKKESKKYLDKKGEIAFTVTMMASIVLSLLFGYQEYFYSIIISYVLVISFISAKSAILIRFKKDFYLEYQKWQAYKKWLSYSDSMKHSDIKGVAIWEKYLAYATALGVSKKVLKQLKDLGYLNDNQYQFYTSYALVSNSLSASSGASSHGGGFGGAGGGGVGGGGGGGR